MFDTVLTGAVVYDGEHDEGFPADVGIQGDRIAAIGNLTGLPAGETLNCSGLSVLPGFIDAHTHSDLYLFNDPGHSRAVLQGVTTEVVGPCGLGVYPLPENEFFNYCLYLKGLLGPLPEGIKFASVDEYLNKVSGCAINVAAQISHGAVRMCAAGFRDVPLTGDYMDAAKRVIETSAFEGAAAFSTGLSYYPATYAPDEEVVALAHAASKYDLPLVSHCRSVFPDNRYNMDTRYAEFLEIARMAGCAVHFSHIKHPRTQAGKPQAFLDDFEQAMNEGLRVTMEMYPYPSGAGFAVVFLPGWVLDGGFHTALERIRNGQLHDRLLSDLAEKHEQIEVGEITYSENHSELVGKTFAQAGAARGQTCEETLLWLLSEESLAVGYRARPPISAEVLEIYVRDYAYLISKPYFVLGSDSEPSHTLAHPRTSGTFPRMARLAREAGVSLGVFAQAASSRSARIFGLRDRGVIREGAYADLVVIREQEIAENCSYEKPNIPPSGIVHVFVNGNATVRDSKVTGLLPGRGLRRGK